MLVLARKVNEQIMIGDEIRVSVVDIRGDQVKIGITAPAQIKVYRLEVYEAIQSENVQAAKTPDTLPDLDLTGTPGGQQRPPAATDDSTETDG